jgi:DNA-binding PadR family transcriptional regulator
VLWLLAEGPLHAYAVVRALSDTGFGFWCPVERGSVYAMLRSLVKEGFVRELRTERDGRRPMRTVFALTRSGRRHHADLLVRAWTEIPVLADPFHAALAARADLDPQTLRSAVDARLAALRDRAREARRNRRAAPDGAIADRVAALAEAELAWLEAAARKWRMEGGRK